jgi:hypothetical protein
MRSVFEPGDRGSLARRLRALRPDAAARWGRMDAPRMLCHIADQMRMALGEVPARPRLIAPLQNRALRFVAVYLLPWPKGRIPTVPEMQSTRAGVWDDDLASTEALLEAVARRGPDGRWAEHPAFGPLSGREWGWLVHKHIDHHLRQFGG